MVFIFPNRPWSYKNIINGTRNGYSSVISHVCGENKHCSPPHIFNYLNQFRIFICRFKRLRIFVLLRRPANGYCVYIPAIIKYFAECNYWYCRVQFFRTIATIALFSKWPVGHCLMFYVGVRSRVGCIPLLWGTLCSYGVARRDVSETPPDSKGSNQQDERAFAYTRPIGGHRIRRGSL